MLETDVSFDRIAVEILSELCDVDRLKMDIILSIDDNDKVGYNNLP